jgi:hypothetical protein
MKVLFLLLFSLVTIYTTAQTTYPSLKAILIVGHQEDGTKDAIVEMDKIATFLAEKKVQVYKYYDNKADWTSICKQANNCHFFIYSGHGIRLNENNQAGGLCLTNNINTSTIQQQLKLNENSMVLFQSVCMGAGTSASDDTDIGIKEAQNRVESYASTFVKSGSQAYYANNFSSGVLNFLKQFFTGKTAEESYKYVAEGYCAIELDTICNFDKQRKVSIATNTSTGETIRTTYTNGVKKVEKVKTQKGYDVAFVGKAAFTLKNMLGN